MSLALYLPRVRSNEVLDHMPRPTFEIRPAFRGRANREIASASADEGSSVGAARPLPISSQESQIKEPAVCATQFMQRNLALEP
jgi:hypothetical protein